MIVRLIMIFVSLISWSGRVCAATADTGAASPAAGVSAWGMALLAVLAVIALISWFMRKFGGFSKEAAANLQIVSTLPLGAREKIVVLKAGGKQLVLAVTPGKIETLHVLDNPLSADMPALPAAEVSFAQRLMQSIAATNTPAER